MTQAGANPRPRWRIGTTFPGPAARPGIPGTPRPSAAGAQ